MSPLILERQTRLDGFRDIEYGRSHGARTRRGAAADAHERPTLDELITGVWEGLAVRDAADCPVCGGRMLARAVPGSTTDAREGACQDCGTTLA